MFMSHKFGQAFASHQGDIVLTRSGAASRVVIPEAFVGHIMFDVNIENNAVVFSSGESVYILTEEFGMLNNNDPIEADMFFIDGGVLIELIDGRVVLKDENGAPYCIDNEGEISYPRHNNKIIYTTHENLRGIAERIIGHRYGAPESMWGQYLDNLLLSTQFYCASTGESPCMTARFITQYEDLGCDQFPFVNYNEMLAVDDEADPDNYDDDDDDDDDVDDDDAFDYEEEEEHEDDF